MVLTILALRIFPRTRYSCKLRAYTVGRNKEAIKKYIANQLQEDQLDEQLSMKEDIDPFTGERVKGSK